LLVPLLVPQKGLKPPGLAFVALAFGPGSSLATDGAAASCLLVPLLVQLKGLKPLGSMTKMMRAFRGIRNLASRKMPTLANRDAPSARKVVH
jgi:hypothetical protein